jgi:hypothetical protein
MKKVVALLALSIHFLTSCAQTSIRYDPFRMWGRLAIGKGNETPPHPSAIVDIGPDTTTRGILMPRVANTDVVASPKVGLVVYSYADAGLMIYTGLGGWQSSGGPATDLSNYYTMWQTDSSIKAGRFVRRSANNLDSAQVYTTRIGPNVHSVLMASGSSSGGFQSDISASKSYAGLQMILGAEGYRFYLGGGGGAFYNDISTVKTGGIKYADNYASSYTPRSLVDKGAMDTAIRDGYFIRYNTAKTDSAQVYTNKIGPNPYAILQATGSSNGGHQSNVSVGRTYAGLQLAAGTANYSFSLNSEGATYSDNSAVKGGGIEYAENYSPSYTDRSLIDRGYLNTVRDSLKDYTDDAMAAAGSFDGQYASLIGIPSTFTPSAHTQDWTTITGAPAFLTSEADGSPTNEGAITVGAGDGTSATIISSTSGSTPVGIFSGLGIGISENTALGRIYVTAVDQSASNEGALTVGAGASNTSIINSSTTGSTGVTITAAGINTISEVGNNITITATELDGSPTNELQSLDQVVGVGASTAAMITVGTLVADNGIISGGSVTSHGSFQANDIASFQSSVFMSNLGPGTVGDSLIVKTGGGAVKALSSAAYLTSAGDGSGLTNTVAYGIKSATTTVAVSAATAPASGQVLRATGTAAATWQSLPAEFIVALSDEATAITTGTAKVTIRMPYAMTVTSVRASLTTASSSGLPTFAIKENGVSILGTALSIDATEKTSTTAVTAATITDSSLANDAEITFDITVAGTGATGAKIYLIGTRN